jgi:hypothetical protein
VQLSESELGQLRSFRRAARQVRDASIIAEGQRIELRAIPNESAGSVDIVVKLLNAEPFRSLALAIRLVYQQREPAQFYSVCNILSRHGTLEVSSDTAKIRSQYQRALNDPARAVRLNDGLEPEIYSATEVFEHWLYGIVFHQDLDRQPAVERLEHTGARFLWAVQAISLQLAGRILDLDDAIAYALGEDLLPRIYPSNEVV